MADLFTFCNELRSFRHNPQPNRERVVSVTITYNDSKARTMIYNGSITSDKNFLGRPDEILMAGSGTLVLNPELPESTPQGLPGFPRETSVKAGFSFVAKAKDANLGRLRGLNDQPPNIQMVDIKLEGDLVEARNSAEPVSRFVISFGKHEFSVA